MAWVGPRPVAPGRRGRPDRAGRCRGAVQRPQACGQTAPGAAVPGVAVGMNHPAPGGLAIAALMVAGCAWATLVTSCWPRPHPPTITPTPPDRAPDPADARLAAGSYAIGFAATAGIGLALGYLLDLVHVAWAAAAAIFIMRPDPGLLASRAVGRTIATPAGVVAGGLLLRRGPTEVAWPWSFGCLAGRSALPLDPGDGGHRGMPQGRQGQATEPTKSAMQEIAGRGPARVPGLVGGGLAAGGRACQHRPARSLHPGRGGSTRLPPPGPRVGPFQVARDACC
jgi:hypothetical protein